MSTEKEVPFSLFKKAYCVLMKNILSMIMEIYNTGLNDYVIETGRLPVIYVFFYDFSAWYVAAQHELFAVLLW